MNKKTSSINHVQKLEPADNQYNHFGIHKHCPCQISVRHCLQSQRAYPKATVSEIMSRAGYQTQRINTGTVYYTVLYCIDTYDTSEGLNHRYYNVLNSKKFLKFYNNILSMQSKQYVTRTCEKGEICDTMIQ